MTRNRSARSWTIREDFQGLFGSATIADLRAPTDGTKWGNQQLLFGMLFEYLLVRNLRILVLTLRQLPKGVSASWRCC